MPSRSRANEHLLKMTSQLDFSRLFLERTDAKTNAGTKRTDFIILTAEIQNGRSAGTSSRSTGKLVILCNIFDALPFRIKPALSVCNRLSSDLKY